MAVEVAAMAGGAAPLPAGAVEPFVAGAAPAMPIAASTRPAAARLKIRILVRTIVPPFRDTMLSPTVMPASPEGCARVSPGGRNGSTARVGPRSGQDSGKRDARLVEAGAGAVPEGDADAVDPQVPDLEVPEEVRVGKGEGDARHVRDHGAPGGVLGQPRARAA